MTYTRRYPSPLGEILLAADTCGVCGLWFVGQKYFARGLEDGAQTGDTEILRAAVRWLDIYFSGREADFRVPLSLHGTPFQREVWKLLLEIPYGQTVTYGTLAARLSERRGGEKMSARAVGGAVGRNPVSVLVPCHRVVGASGQLTGYAGGIERKAALLRWESAAVARK